MAEKQGEKANLASPLPWSPKDTPLSSFAPSGTFLPKSNEQKWLSGSVPGSEPEAGREVES